MIVKHRLNLDLIKRGVTQRIDAVQDDCCSRALEMRLFANGMAYAVPENCTVLIRYQKPDGIGGAYDTLPDGSSAWSVDDGVLTVVLAPQVCTVAGTVELSVTLLRETVELSTFMLLVDVQAAPGGAQSSREYVNVQAFLPQPGGLVPGQYLMVKAVDTYGNATVIGSGDGGAASVMMVGAEQLGHGEAPRVTEAPGSSQWNRKYILGIPAGVPGYTPVRGLDYWTAEDYAVMQQENRDYLAGELAKRAQTAPLFVSSLSDCADADKIYILPDGYIYAYMNGAWTNTGHRFMPKGDKGDKGEPGAPGKDGKDGTEIAGCSYVAATLPKGRAKGDVNGDGIINIDDMYAIQAHSSGTTVITDSIALWAAECDGYVNAFAVVQYINKQYDRYIPYAADYYGNWQFDSANGHYYYDIAANGMTADCGCIIVPNVTFKGFKQAIPMSGAIRMCFKGCPTEEILCRILYNTELEGVTVENGVANSFLDGGGSGGVGIKAITIEEVGTVLISFTIDGWGTYQAKEGMTWAEWIESEYNTIGAEADGKDVIFPDDPDWNSTWYVLDEDGNSVTPDDVIAADYTYLVE